MSRQTPIDTQRVLDTFHVYFAMFKSKLMVSLQYKAAALAGIFTQIFFGLVIVSVYKAFYHHSNAVVPLTLSEIITYTWLTQIFFRTLPFKCDGDIEEIIRSGGVVYEFTRPFNVHLSWFVRSLAARVNGLIVQSIPMAIFCLLFTGISLPASSAQSVYFLISMLLAVILSAAVVNLLNVSMIATISGEGINKIIPAISWSCSGVFLPLSFYPDWLYRIVYYLPFRGIVDLPYSIYLGQVDHVYYEFLYQLCWIVIISTTSFAMFNRFRQKLIVQGG